MATRTFRASSSNGVVMITKSGKTEAQLDAIEKNPYSYLDDIYFHSSLDYVQGTGKAAVGSVTFPAVTRTVVSWSTSSSCFGLC
jgi:hypothetical protein